MKPAAEIPVDDFLDQALSALITTDASMLRRLESAAPTVAAPVSRARYLKDRDTFAALLEATGRNLRFLRRATQRQPHSRPR
ncbi:MAG: hypothetical protein WAM66_11430 [Acidobacteriaceae bacterium]